MYTPILIDSKVKSGQSHRFFVQLASKAIEVTDDGYPVPVSTTLLDVLVAEPTKEAIIEALNQEEWLEDYDLKEYWQPCTDGVADVF